MEENGSAAFDQFAKNYSELHDANVSASGESGEYFALHKLGCIERLGLTAETPILDYGCGTGVLIQHLSRKFSAVHGYDPSRDCLKVARERAPGATFSTDPASVPEGGFGAVVLASVLHHVPVAERDALLAMLVTKLAPGGRLIVFEHNPWNPLTRQAVATCAFDHDAILLWPGEVRRRLRTAGLARVRQDYVVFFPRSLAKLRFLEPRLHWLFLGAQTMTVGTRA
jgi:2-polyprenyl-3-methyl-5-hydroxy-6-metoxy-1,4-benzoquinol methylase